MDKNTVLVFTANGMGNAPQELQHLLTNRFLGLLLDGESYPPKSYFTPMASNWRARVRLC